MSYEDRRAVLLNLPESAKEEFNEGRQKKKHVKKTLVDLNSPGITTSPELDADDTSSEDSIDNISVEGVERRQQGRLQIGVQMKPTDEEEEERNKRLWERLKKQPVVDLFTDELQSTIDAIRKTTVAAVRAYLLIVPEHDQFGPNDHYGPEILKEWPFEVHSAVASCPAALERIHIPLYDNLFLLSDSYRYTTRNQRASTSTMSSPATSSIRATATADSSLRPRSRLNGSNGRPPRSAGDDGGDPDTLYRKLLAAASRSGFPLSDGSGEDQRHDAHGQVPLDDAVGEDESRVEDDAPLSTSAVVGDPSVE